MDRLTALLYRLLTIGSLMLGGVVMANNLPPDCGELANHYGPYDYTNSDHFHNKLPVVEQFHFNKEQELSTFDPTSKRPVDFGYTLRAFPNHHRALMALARYVKYHPNREWKGLRPECYFLRAIAFRPNDAVAHMIYGFYLQQHGKTDAAEASFKNAVRISPDYAEAHYNLGLLYTDQKRWVEARTHAQKAYALNYPLPGLRKKLTEAGQWQAKGEAP